MSESPNSEEMGKTPESQPSPVGATPENTLSPDASQNERVADAAGESVATSKSEPAELQPCPNCGMEMQRNRGRCANCGAALPPNPVLNETPLEIPLLTGNLWRDRITGALAALALSFIPLGVFALPLLYFLTLRRRYPAFASGFGVVSLVLWILLCGAFVLCFGFLGFSVIYSYFMNGRGGN